MSAFDYIQTFNVNSNKVNGASEIMMTSVDLYFQAKPALGRNVSGSVKPGINVWVCEITNNSPNINRIVKNSTKSIEYDNIPTDTNAATPTGIGFDAPVILKTNRKYGIVVKFDDPGFDIWENVLGDALVGIAGKTNTPSTGTRGWYDGDLFRPTNSGGLKAFSNRDLKFRVNIAQFVSNTATINLVNKPYEFFTIDSSSGSLKGGEWVYQNVANATGTVTLNTASQNVVGSGTTFTNINVGNFVTFANSTATETIKVTNVSNTTHMTLEKRPNISGLINYKLAPVGRVHYIDYTTNKIYLSESNANSTVKFVSGTRIIGERSRASANVSSLDRLTVDKFEPKFLLSNPSTSTYAINYRLSNSANGIISTSTNLDLLEENNTKQESYILSRSLETATYAGNMYGNTFKSAVANVNININLSNNEIFEVPYLNSSELDFFVKQFDVNDTYRETRYGITDFDTEVEKNGLAKSKTILKKVTFAADKYSEDLKVYMTAYRPANTELRIYAKLHNSADTESFSEKSWTPLTLIDNVDKFSASETDLVEYEYGLPQYPEVFEGLTGNFTTESANAVILASSDPSGNISSGDLVRVYDPLTVENHEVFVVQSSNSTAFVVNKNITNVNIIGDVQVEKLKYKNAAWRNVANDNVARYVSTSQVEFDTFNSMQFKIVYLANNSYIVPKAEQLQVIGVSS